VSPLLAGDKTALISAFDVGVAVCSAPGFFVGSSASLTPEISLMISVAESARAGDFGRRAARRGFLARLAAMGMEPSFWVSGFLPSPAADGSWIGRIIVTTAPRPVEERLAALMTRWQRP
jgi:hypothetical protein